jgi:hypothetical protein
MICRQKVLGKRRKVKGRGRWRKDEKVTRQRA